MPWCMVVAILVAAACGSVRQQPSSDAPAADAAVPGPVTVMVTAQNKPLSGARIVFGNADGTVAMAVTTGNTGIATVDMLPGSMVTAAQEDTQGTPVFTMFTVFNVQPGDVLAINLV